MQVLRKGMEQGKYALENLELFLNRLGYDKVILQHDAEHAVGAVAKALQRHLGSAQGEISRSEVSPIPRFSRVSQCFLGRTNPDAMGIYEAAVS